jgi:hypothetical protein
MLLIHGRGFLFPSRFFSDECLMVRPVPARNAKRAATSRIAVALRGRVVKKPPTKPSYASSIGYTGEMVKVDGPNTYKHVVLNNGVKVHLFGETHDVISTCKTCTKPNCVTLTEYVSKLVIQARKNKQYLDVFIESEMLDKRWTPLANRWMSGNEFNQKYSDYSAEVRVTVQLGRTKKNADWVRAHQIDIRGKELHPFLGANNLINHASYQLKNLEPDIGKIYGNSFLEFFVAMLDSDTYTQDMLRHEHKIRSLPQVGVRRQSRRHYAAKYPRNVTSYGNRTNISRVRKALLKLRPDIARRIRDEAVSMAHKLSHRRQYGDYGHGYGVFLNMALMMDVYTVARMLYYAGYGTTAPPEGTSAVQLAHGGAAHTRRWAHLLKASGVVKRISNSRGPKCVSAPEVDANANYDLTYGWTKN